MVKIQLVTAKGLASKMIRDFTWSDYSHVDFVMPDGNLLGAHLSGGVAVREPNYEVFTAKLVGEIPLSPIKSDLVYRFAQGQIGKKYDLTAIINFGFHKRNWREDDCWFCSELVAWCFEQARIPLLNPAVDVWRITPRDISLSPVVNWEK